MESKVEEMRLRQILKRHLKPSPLFLQIGSLEALIRKMKSANFDRPVVSKVIQDVKEIL